MKIVSACLIGINCRYDGSNCINPAIKEIVEKGEAIPVCPEQLGGLPTPRTPAELQPDGKVLNKNGEDVTGPYSLGAKEAYKIALLASCNEAFLKSKSPMCGSKKIYDGSFSGNLIEGDGIFAKLLKQNNIQVTPVE